MEHYEVLFGSFCRYLKLESCQVLDISCQKLGITLQGFVALRICDDGFGIECEAGSVLYHNLAGLGDNIVIGLYVGCGKRGNAPKRSEAKAADTKIFFMDWYEFDL